MSVLVFMIFSYFFFGYPICIQCYKKNSPTASADWGVFVLVVGESSNWSLDQVVFQGNGDRLRTGGCIQFGEDAADMEFGGG